MELEDYVEKLEKQKRAERKERKKKERVSTYHLGSKGLPGRLGLHIYLPFKSWENSGKVHKFSQNLSLITLSFTLRWWTPLWSPIVEQDSLTLNLLEVGTRHNSHIQSFGITKLALKVIILFSEQHHFVICVEATGSKTQYKLFHFLFRMINLKPAMNGSSWWNSPAHRNGNYLMLPRNTNWRCSKRGGRTITITPVVLYICRAYHMGSLKSKWFHISASLEKSQASTCHEPL